MRTPGGNSNYGSSGFSKRGVTRDFLRNFGAAAASRKPSSKTLGVNSMEGSSGFDNGGRTLDLLRNFKSVATASCGPSSATSRKREPSPSLELTLALPGMKTPKKRFCKSEQPSLPNRPPDLPRVFRQRIESLGGQEVQLVMQKVLTCSDLSSHLARLLLPENQMRRGTNFLRREEIARVNEKMEIAVGVISSNLEEKVLRFKFWLMGKRGRVGGGAKPKATRVYSLQGGWVGFANENELKENDRVQLWSFRVNDDTHRDSLKFVIVNLEGGGNGDREGDNAEEAIVHQ